MTSENLPKILPIPMPFAKDALTNPYDFIKNNDDGKDSALSFREGFASRFASAGSDGKFVTREMMNALGFLASANDYARLCGKIFTFDPVVCTAIGGYAKGAVLDYVYGTDHFKVMSLVDDNFVDFTANTDTDTYANITNGSVDGVNWIFMNIQTGTTHQTLAEVPTGSWYTPGATLPSMACTGSMMIGSGTALKSGTIIVKGSIDWEARPIVTSSETSGAITAIGIRVNGGTELPIASFLSTVVDETNYAPIQISAGDSYVIRLVTQNCIISRSDMKIMV